MTGFYEVRAGKERISELHRRWQKLDRELRKLQLVMELRNRDPLASFESKQRAESDCERAERRCNSAYDEWQKSARALEGSWNGKLELEAD